MSVFIIHAGTVISVPTENDLDPTPPCGVPCEDCLASGTNGCPARVRRFEQLADDRLRRSAQFCSI